MVMKQLNKLWHEVKGYRPREIVEVIEEEEKADEGPKDKSALGTDRPADAPKSVYIYGSVGTGKTMVMDLFYSTLGTDRKRRVHYHAFMLEIHARIHALRTTTAQANPIGAIAQEIVENTTVLCLDEFQVTDIADAMLLRQLVDELFERGLVLVTTSNRHPSELYENGHSRALFYPCIRRLLTDCHVVCLDAGIDYRTTFAPHPSRPAFVHPLNAATTAHMAALRHALTGGKPMRPMSVAFLGRSLTVPAQVDGVMAATFHDLCSEALSAADYLEIVRRFHTLILADIPAIMRRAEARRFITLIDALYESRVRLFASADCDINEIFFRPGPEQLDDNDQSSAASSLFTGEEEVFALRRALSRLREMQSESWIGVGKEAHSLPRLS
ncbi:AFG1-like ATPase-domain-containing protein [Dichotomocladium elegans]|nr:AFG1-like ATPase-domain-containing protein [Dichotomocladium elegans]